MNSNPLSIGTVLNNGRYRILSILGRGGFGITYMVEDIRSNRRMAIKELFAADLCGRENNSPEVKAVTASAIQQIESIKAKFIKEAKTLMQINHEGIVKVYDMFEENGTAYYVMDYLQGHTLDYIVSRQGPFSTEKALKIIDRVADALQYIHDRRLNHLDVKPDNIILRNDTHEVILIDFGLSKHYDHNGRQTSHTPVGISKGYAPLEQYSGEGVATFAPEADIYSLCATLYFLLSGITPPEAVELASRSLPRPFEIADNNLWMAILKGMAANPGNRFHSVQEFRNALTHPSGKSPQATIASTGMANPTVRVVPVQPAQNPFMPQQHSAKGSKTAMWFLIGAGIVAVMLIIGALSYSDNDTSTSQNDEYSTLTTEEKTTEAKENQPALYPEEKAAAPQANTANEVPTLYLTGSIGDDYGAEMSINPSGGYYIFLNTQRNTVVDSYDAQSGNLVISGYNSNKKYIGTFRGRLRNGTYSGTFTNYKNQTIQFNLSE